MKKTLLTILCGSLLMGSTTSCGLAEWAVMSQAILLREPWWVPLLAQAQALSSVR